MKEFQISLRHRSGLSVCANDDVDGSPLREQYGAALDPVRKLDDAALGSRHFGLNDDFIVVSSRSVIAAIRFSHREISVFFPFEIAIGESTFPAKISAAYFHPDQVIRVIDHSHLVRFGITNAEAGFRNVRHQAVFSTREGRSRPSS